MAMNMNPPNCPEFCPIEEFWANAKIILKLNESISEQNLFPNLKKNGKLRYLEIKKMEKKLMRSMDIVKDATSVVMKLHEEF